MILCFFMVKRTTSYGRVYHVTTSHDPEDRGEAIRDPLDDIGEYFKHRLIALSDAKFIDQDAQKNVYFITLSDNFPPRINGEYNVEVKIESFTQFAYKDLADVLLKMGI